MLNERPDSDFSHAAKFSYLRMAFRARLARARTTLADRDVDEESSKTGDTITDILTAISIALIVFFLAGCGLDSGFAPSEYRNFWSQCTKFDGWGFTMASPYGPMNIGKLTWERNVACDVDINQSMPSIPK